MFATLTNIFFYLNIILVILLKLGTEAFPLLNSFDITEAALLFMQAMLLYDVPFSQIKQSYAIYKNK